MTERLTVGVAARLSRYLQVLTQAKKMGKERISSQEISDYTNINATQIRRDLSGFGKFGKRGVGYNIDSLLGEIRKILRTQGQHNIALIGAGRLGETIASSPIFAEHGSISPLFDTDPEKVGRRVGNVEVTPYGGLLTPSKKRTSSSACSRAGDERAAGRRRPDRRGRQIIFNYGRRSSTRPLTSRCTRRIRPSSFYAVLPSDGVGPHGSHEPLEPRSPRRFPLCESAVSQSFLPPARSHRVKILLWHGYLLGGTARTSHAPLARMEPRRARRRALRRSPSQLYDTPAFAVRPEIGSVLPVFVFDRYEGLDARLLPS